MGRVSAITWPRFRRAAEFLHIATTHDRLRHLVGLNSPTILANPVWSTPGRPFRANMAQYTVPGERAYALDVEMVCP